MIKIQKNLVSKEEIEFYKKQGIRTKVKKGTFDKIPNEIEKICRIEQGLIIHPGTLRLHHLNLPEKRINERSIKTVQELLNRIKQLDHSELIYPREPEKRVVGICKHFSILLCSILREKGIPARTRCGFATYFQNGWFEDHWICEYWNKKEKRWTRVDAQIDDLQAVAYHIDREKITLTDLPKGVFFPAGVLWKLYREGFVEGKVEGFSLVPKEYGEWYIRGNMLRYFFALNEIEYLYSEEDLLMERSHNPSKKELELLDKIAEITSKPDINFKEIREVFKNNQSLLPKKHIN